MRFAGREIDVGIVASMLAENPGACFFQGVQRVRQGVGLDYKGRKDGSAFYPVSITFEITHNCNLRCKTCWFWGTSGACHGNEGFEVMSLEEIKKFIDSISWFKPYFLITGGEPLLYPKLDEVIRYASSKGLFVGLITNGLISNEGKIKGLIEAGLNFVTVSIDSPVREVHNEIRGNVKSFDNAVETVRLIKRLRGRKKFPVVTVNLTISKYNYLELDKMLDLGESLNVDVLNFQHQWFSDAKTARAYNLWAEKNLGLKSEYMGSFETDSAFEVDGERVYESLSKIKERAKIFVRVFPDINREETEKYYNGMEPVFNSYCVAPWYAVIVKPKGDVVPCVDFVVGNVKEKSFKDIWNSDKMKHFRKKVKENKHFPGCTRCCGFFQR